jgi:uncharacterized membrane protein
MWGSILTEWASLILRWLHVVAAIGWIGSSFYFIHLDLSLKPDGELPDGVAFCSTIPITSAATPD